MSGVAQAQNESVITEEKVTNLFDGVAFQINRATALIRAIEKDRKNHFVPVDRDAVRVQAAVRRRDPSSGGMQISFDLYRDMLDEQIRAARNMTFEIVGDLSGDLVTDAKKIKRYMKNGGKGLSPWEEFLLYADQWLILFLLDRLTTQFQCTQHKECTAAKNPPGVEDPFILQRNIESIAALLLILGMREADVLLALGQAGNALNVPPVDILNRAKRLERTDLDRALTELVGADDPQAITSYVDNYITRHPDGYDDWIAYRDLRVLREDALVTYVHAPEYSSQYAKILDFESTSVTRTPTVGIVGQVAGVITPRPMLGSHYEAMVSQLGGIDLAISSIAGTMTFQYGLDVLCCVARFFSKQDLRTLRKIRKLLEVYKAGLVGGLPTAFLATGNPLDWATQAILKQLIGFIEDTFDKAVGDIWSWVANKSDEQWEALYECPLIADLIAFIAEAVSRYRGMFFNFITKYAGNISSNYQGMFRRWGSLSDFRRVSSIIGLIDLILSTAEACAVQDGGGGSPSPIPDPIDDPGLMKANPKRLSIPPEHVQSFFSDTGYIDRGTGRHPIPPVNHVVTTGDPGTTVGNFRNLCLGILPTSLLDQVDKASEAK